MSTRKQLKGQSGLDTACADGNVEAVKVLLEEKSRPPVLTSTKRKSKDLLSVPEFATHQPIHTACQARNPSTAEVVRLLLSSERYSVADKTANGDTALHVACFSGNLPAVQALLDSSKQESITESLKHQNKELNTPVHAAASQSGSVKILELLLGQCLLPSDLRHVLSRLNKMGASAVGLAIKKGSWDCVKVLLKYSQDNPLTLYGDFSSSVPQCAPTCRFIRNLQAFEHKPNDVFLLGDSKSGKSTLVRMFQHSKLSSLSKLATNMKFWKGNLGTVNNDANRVPVTVEYHHQDHKCPVTFHEAVSQRCYSLEGIFKCSHSPMEALYIITVDVRKNIQDNVLYWLSFLHHQFTENRYCMQGSTRKPPKIKVMVVFTYCDLVTASYLDEVKSSSLSEVIKANEDLTAQFIWCGNYYLNSRRYDALDMPLVMKSIHNQCNFAHDHVELESKHLLTQTYILAGVILKTFDADSVTTFSNVVGLVQNCDDPLCRMLPSEDAEIENLCHNLDCFSTFKVLIFEGSRKNKQYIVLNYKLLLESVNDGLDYLSQCAKNAIVTRPNIAEAFRYHTDFIVQFLEHNRLCEFISRDGLETTRMSIRSSRRSKTSLGSSTSTLNSLDSHKSVFDVPKITGIPLPQPPSSELRRHRRTQSESHTETTTETGKDTDHLSASAQGTMFGQKKSLSVMKLYYPGTTPPHHHSSTQSSRNPSPMSSRHSSRNPSPLPSKRRKSSKLSSSSFRHKTPHYFFPSLVSSIQPKDIWDDSSKEYTYGFAWSLVPYEDDCWFFSPKFITIVLFRLLFSFAPHPTSPKSFVDRECKLWNRGILWSDTQGARVCVAVHNDNELTLSMQCLQRHEVACLSIRNEIMSDIKQQLREIHPQIEPHEIFIPFDEVSIFPIIEPLQSYMVFDKEEIQHAILENRLPVSTRGIHKELDSLLHFEPLSYFTQPLLEELFNRDNQREQLKDDFCMQLAKNLSTKWTYLAHHLNTVLEKYYIDCLVKEQGTPHYTAMEMLTHLREISYKEEDERVDTYGGFCKSLFEISIFTPDELKNEHEHSNYTTTL